MFIICTDRRIIMPGYIILDVKTKKTFTVCAVIGLALFVIGIIIGYFSRKPDATSNIEPQENVAEALRASCKIESRDPTTLTYFSRYVERHNEKNACITSAERCLDFALPRNYIAYHTNGQTINIDGKLDEQAWREVTWSENFLDMRSEVYPAPYLDTRFKIMWDDENLYIGAFVQEDNIWATYTEHDSQIWEENGFEVLMDVDGTMFNYKQLQINALGTKMDQLFKASPFDSDTARVMSWHSGSQSAVYLNGTINNPGDIDKGWTVEWAIPFSALSAESSRVQAKVSNNEVWFLQLGRSEQKLKVVNGKYEYVDNSTTDWWSWQPCDTINLHLQDRWGLVQFKTNHLDKQFNFQMWHVYRSLFDMMDGMKKYKAIHGRYTTAIEELDIPPYLMMGACVELPEVRLLDRNNASDFDVTIKSKFVSHRPAHIRSDRYVSFY